MHPEPQQRPEPARRTRQPLADGRPRDREDIARALWAPFPTGDNAQEKAPAPAPHPRTVDA